MASSSQPSVLSGVRVLDFGHYIAQYLGYSADRIAALTQSGVLVQEPLVKEFRERGEIQ